MEECMKYCEVLEQKMAKELELIANRYSQNPAQQMTEKDIEIADKLFHAMKSMATYKAMKEAEEYEEGGASGARMTYSGRRGRGADGRYVSREGGESYAEGYSRGYEEGMNRSGHYPMPYYPNGRW